MEMKILSVISLLFFTWIRCVRTASFYGSSYISTPIQEARSSTDLSFRFRTSRQDTLIFLAAGRTDYCLVVLQSAALKVRINLGAGEAEVATPRGIRLDDLLWHHVRIHRKDADFTLTVDGVHSTKLRLPGRFYELNIHYGLFVGGLGDFREIFLGLWDNFRGCIEDLHYNGVDVLAKARDKSIQAESNGVTWDCSVEFDATSEQDISFQQVDSSFVTFSSSLSKTGSTVRLGLKTLTREGVVLYNSGPPAKADFVAVELVEGHIRVSMDNGAGLVDLFSESAVNDGQWHQLDLQLSASAISLTIDGHSNGLRSAGSLNSAAGGSTSGKYMELTGQVYLGGIESVRQARAEKQGVRNANSSVQGCIRRLDVDGRVLGLADARVTRNVSPDCGWHYPCSAPDNPPCLESAVCHQMGMDSFRCDCLQPPCTRPEFTTPDYPSALSTLAGTGVTSASSSDPPSDLLHLSPMQVTEGGSMTLTSRHVQVAIDYEKFGVRESGVLLHVVRPPQYGRLFSSLWRRADEATFTLLDVHSDRVRYVHDGSETTRDSVLLELELAPRAGFLLPAYLQKRQRFVLQIAVTAVNDPPELSLPPGKVLRLVKNTRKALSADLLTAVDPDNPPADLVYMVLNSRNDANDAEGYVENVQQPGAPVTSFTQEDVNQGHVFYVHRGSPNGRLALRVSDGAESGPTAVLRISAFELQTFLVNNTGLVVPVNGSAPLSQSNLTFATNAPDQDLDIRFDIIRPPQFGSIQKWKMGVGSTPGRWQTISWFTWAQLGRERIRYVHQNGTGTAPDDFKFSVSVPEAEFKSPASYEFRMQFLSAVLKAERSAILTMKGQSEARIGSGHLKFVTDPYATPDDDIYVTLTQMPLYGSLWIAPSAAKESKWAKLSAGSRLPQSIVTSARLEYRLNRRTLSVLQDRFYFQVSTAFLTSAEQVFQVSYIPSAPSIATITLDTLPVNEGESAAIRPQQLSITAPGVHLVNYTVTRAPGHGQLNLLDVGKRQLQRRNITSFTSEEVADERIVYTHDDSESTDDQFEFLALPKEGLFTSDTGFQYLGYLNISVRMKNDNPPARAADRILHVVTNGQRLLSPSILRYSDPDVNSNPADIVYTRRGIPNGALYHTDRPDVQVFQFSQADIDDGKVLFKHQGNAYGRIALWVTDGQFHTTGILEVQASDPFLERVNSSVLVVRRGSSVPVTVDQIGLASNMDFRPEEVSFHVAEEPHQGTLELAGSKIDSFELTDLLSASLMYNNNNQMSFKDKFKFRASLKSVELEGLVDIRIYPEAYWQPLKVFQNKPVTVEESTSVTIDQSSLKILHPNIVPADIVYIVHQPPQHGYLEIDHEEDHEYDDDTTTNTKSLPPEVNVFDQSAINENRLHYIQSGANQTSDSFVFDVTNGIVTLYNITFQLAIIPKYIYVDARPVEVLEGGHVSLTASDIKILSPYYVDKVSGFLITRPPAHGLIQLKTPADPLNPSTESIHRFSYQQLSEKQVVYWHDSSEESNDTLELVALAGRKESLPATLLIRVRPVDDERPVLVNNTGVLVWQGSRTVLEPAVLAAADVDTLPASIQFVFGDAPCGHLAAGRDWTERVHTFTQQQVNDGQVAFVHDGGQGNCTLNFTLTDGQSLPSQHQTLVGTMKMRLQVKRNLRLHVFPMMQQSITSSHLLVVTSDPNSVRWPRFRITRPPVLGRLLLEQADGSTQLVTSFTQRDLNQSLLIYEHTEPFADLSVNDSFVFDVSVDLSDPLESQLFHIEISVATMAEGGLDRYLGLAHLETEEGGVAVIRDRNLNLTSVIQLISSYRGPLASEPPKLRLVLSQAPLHGFVAAGGQQVDEGGDIPIADVLRGEALYRHDHSDTLADRLGLSIYLQRDEGSEIRRPDILLFNGSLDVNILPVNDEVFILVTKAPAMQVVQRQSRLITSDILLTEDADTAPRDLIYEIIQPPSHGKLGLVDNVTASVQRFTQDDVNRQRVVYLHDGTMESTSFYFRVSDGHFKPVSGVFSIHFAPLTLKVANNSAVPMQQGHTTGVIRNVSIAAETNGQRRHIFFNVTREPQFGRLYVNDAVVSTFGQSNIDKEELLYVQFNMTASSDWFQATVWNPEISIADQIFNITVTPLVSQQRIRAVIGDKTPVTSAMLDASKLAALTNSNPVFSVVRKPRFGRIRKIIPSSSGQTPHQQRLRRQAPKEKDTSVFTHEDIQSEFIFYVLRKLDLNESTIDSLEYVLTAPNVQPAVGTLEFMILPTGTLMAASKSSIDGSGPNSGRKEPPRHDAPPVVVPDIVTENTLAGMGITSDIVLIVGIICGVLILGLVVLIAVSRCRVKHQAHKKQNQEADNRSPQGDMQLYRLSGSIKNGKRNISEFEVTDAYRVPRSLNRDFGESELDSDPEPPPPLPRLDHFDTPLSPRPPRARRINSPISASSTISSIQGRTRGSWHDSAASRDTPPSVPQCKIIPLNPLISGSESETSELVNARYPYGMADDSLEEWAMLDPDARFSPRTTNPMLRKNQYWV